MITDHSDYTPDLSDGMGCPPDQDSLFPGENPGTIIGDEDYIIPVGYDPFDFCSSSDDCDPDDWVPLPDPGELDFATEEGDAGIEYPGGRAFGGNTGGFFPVTLDALEEIVIATERKNGTVVPVTVGVLLADARRQFCKENILPFIDALHRESGQLIDFFIPGYFPAGGEGHFRLGGTVYVFSEEAYMSVFSALQNRYDNVSGNAQLFLISYEKGHLRYADNLVFDLETMVSSGKIDSAYAFLRKLIRISKKSRQFKKFKQQLSLERAGTAVLEFVKQFLPSALITVAEESAKAYFGFDI